MDKKNEIIVTEDKEASEIVKEKVEFANVSAKQLKDILSQRPRKIIIQGREYIDFEGYQTIASFYGYNVGIEWTKPLKRDDVSGYEARAVVYNQDGRSVSMAESACMNDEMNWKGKPDFQLRSMAQTRASVKALRMVFAWVVVLAGYSPTPSEEMVEDEKKVPVDVTASKIVECAGCGTEVRSALVISKSMEKYGKVLCFPKCQAEEARIRKGENNGTGVKEESVY